MAQCYCLRRTQRDRFLADAARSEHFLDPIFDSLVDTVRERWPDSEVSRVSIRRIDLQHERRLRFGIGVGRRWGYAQGRSQKLWYVDIEGDARLPTPKPPDAGDLEPRPGRGKAWRIWSRLRPIDANRPSLVTAWVVGALEVLIAGADVRGSGPPQADGSSLWCEPGGHAWTRPSWKGRPPRACPEHATGRRVSHPSDDPDCFRMSDGWAVRIEVSADNENAEAFDVPVALAAHLGILPDDVRTFKHERHDQQLVVRRGRQRTRGHLALDRLVQGGVSREDLLFVEFYSQQFRTHRIEEQPRSGEGAVARLVGLDDDSGDGLFWRRVARRLGVPGHTVSAVLAAAERRGDLVLAAAVRAASRDGQPTGWRSGWDLTAPLLRRDEAFVLAGPNGQLRVAVGLADPRDTLPHRFVITPGGVVWREATESDDLSAHEPDLAADIRVPAMNLGWVRLMQTEHLLRRRALSGDLWNIAYLGHGRWAREGREPAESLMSALAGTASVTDRSPTQQAVHLNHQIARTPLALERAFERAGRDGLVALESSMLHGFLTRWTDGGENTSSSILGALAPA